MLFKQKFILKIFSIILSIYIIALTLIPCVDNYSDSCMNKQEFVNNDDNSHPLDIDLCSPFCVCNCCGTSISISLNIFIPIKTIPITLYFPNTVPKIADIAYSFWQPPKI